MGVNGNVPRNQKGCLCKLFLFSHIHVVAIKYSSLTDKALGECNEHLLIRIVLSSQKGFCPSDVQRCGIPNTVYENKIYPKRHLSCPSSTTVSQKSLMRLTAYQLSHKHPAITWTYSTVSQPPFGTNESFLAMCLFSELCLRKNTLS